MKKQKPKITLRKSFKYSFLLHFAAFCIMLGLPLLAPGCGGGNGNGKGGSKQNQNKGNNPDDGRQIKEKEEIPTEIEIYTKPQEKTKADIAREKWRKHIQDCPQFFGGIGIVYGAGGVIERVYKGYPADEAGLQPGDYITTDNVRGDIGTPVDVQYTRNGIPYTVTIIRGKICLEDTLPPDKDIQPEVNPYGH